MCEWPIGISGAVRSCRKWCGEGGDWLVTRESCDRFPLLLSVKMVARAALLALLALAVSPAVLGQSSNASTPVNFGLLIPTSGVSCMRGAEFWMAAEQAVVREPAARRAAPCVCPLLPLRACGRVCVHGLAVLPVSSMRPAMCGKHGEGARVPV